MESATDKTSARWVGRATMVWAVVYAGFGLACALSGTPVFYLGRDPAPSVLGLGVVAVGSLAAVVCGAIARSGPRPALRMLLWGTCGLAGIAAFGLLMDVITLMFGARWLPLVPALIGAATLAPYGVFGVGYATLATAGVVTMRQGDFHSSNDALLVTWIGMSAFAVYGVALVVATRSYWLRTRRVSALVRNREAASGEPDIA